MLLAQLSSQSKAPFEVYQSVTLLWGLIFRYRQEFYYIDLIIAVFNKVHSPV